MKRTLKGKPASRSFGPGPSSTFGGFTGLGGSDARSSLSYLSEPPAFGALTDPNVVVSFKNLLKKDPTTKTKALEELVAYVQAHPFEKDGGVEDAVLDVWVQLYPRTSIDNARRVRELSYILQFELMKSARKRMQRHIPAIVGAWLAGLYDRDRVVARAANDGLLSFLTTPEKILGFWKKCHSQVLDYAIDAIQETQETLSDERSTTKEESEAKYFRVITSSLSLVLGLLQKMEDDDIEQLQSRYVEFFSEDSVWKSITLNDSTVRKAVCQLLFACLGRKLPYATETKARQAFVTGGLKMNQAGSALEFVRALTKLTQSCPEIWISSREKKPPLIRLHTFIAKGSQGSPSKFWEYLDQLLSVIPTTSTPEEASALLTSLKSGVTHREEPRINASFAWKCYVNTAKRLLEGLSVEEQITCGREHILPLFEQFLLSASEKPTTVSVEPNAMEILVDAYVTISGGNNPLSIALQNEWDRLATVLCASISGSLPEVSKDFQSSQEKISEEGRRWFGLVGQISQRLKEIDRAIPDFTEAPSAKIISQCISMLESRNLKPFGAARVIEYSLSTTPHIFQDDKWRSVYNFLLFVVEDGISRVLESPSSRHLLSCVRLLGSFPRRGEDFTQLWNTWVSETLALSPGPIRNDALASLVSFEKCSDLSRRRQDLQEVTFAQTLTTAQGEGDAWSLLQAAVTYQALSETIYHSLSKELVSLLEKQPQHSANVLKALEVLVKGRPQLFSTNEELHTSLIAQLLSLSEIGDNSVSAASASIRSLLDSQSGGKLPVVEIIQSNLDRAGPQSLEYVVSLSSQIHADNFQNRNSCTTS